MTQGDHLIWSNHHLDLDDWKAEIEAEHPGLTEGEMFSMMLDMNYTHLKDQRTNLNIQLSRSILVIADLGLWQGRRSGYKEIASGNIKDCLYSEHDFTTWYVDRLGDLRCDDTHHDGTNHYLYRVYKEGATETQIENLKEKIYRGTATREDIVRVTRRLGDEIGQVYGWRFPQRTQPRRVRTRKVR